MENRVFNTVQEQITYLYKVEQENFAKSLGLVETESNLFQEALSLQYAALASDVLTWEAGKGSTAAVQLFLLGFNSLRTGWLSLLQGYYTSALSQLRLANEAYDFAAAVSLSDKDAARWWDGKLDISDARKTYQKELELRVRGSGAQWASDHLDHWRSLNSFAHASPKLTMVLLEKTGPKQSMVPHLGPWLNQKYLISIAIWYVVVAADGVAVLALALSNVADPSSTVWETRRQLLTEAVSARFTKQLPEILDPN